MSLLRLPALDRPTYGLTKRFSFLSTNTASSTQDDPTSSMVSLQTLPSVDCLDSQDFLNMFEGPYVSSPEAPNVQDNKQVVSFTAPVELSSRPTTSRFPQLHGKPSRRFEIPSSPTLQPQSRLTKATTTEQKREAEMSYSSSVASSNPSTKRSNASSRRSRKSSMTSMGEDVSSSERSSKESDKENALHERLKRRSKDKRISLGSTHAAFSAEAMEQPRIRARSETHLLDIDNHQSRPLQGWPACPAKADYPSVRPCSRGKRLGKAMADGFTMSPPATPTRSIVDMPTTSPPELPRMSSKRVPRKAANTSPVVHLPTRLTLPREVDGIERIRIGIMASLDNVDDLRNCAQVSRDFYLAFQKHETLLVDSVLYHQSSAAWDLRHSVRHLEKPSPFRLRSVQRDYATIHALEDFIVWKCESILRPQTLKALLGQEPQRRAELEDAIWTIWSFANKFGKTSMSDAALVKQTQWLNGSATHEPSAGTDQNTHRKPCTTKQLEDMNEMWRCLEMLLSGFKGREAEARQAGLFDNVGETQATDRQLLSLWIHDILSLGPKAVLTLSSCDFEQAKVLGITRWTPPAKGKSRSNFLKAAVEEVYRDRLMTEARQKAVNYRQNVQHSHKRSHSDPQRIDAPMLSRPPVAQNRTSPPRLDTRVPCQSMPAGGYSSIAERFEVRPDCDPLSPVHQSPVVSPSTNPGVFSPLVMTKNASTKLGATLFPMQNRDQSHRLSVPSARAGHERTQSDNRSIADVIDPTDQAVALMVQEMGFSEAEAKRALAMSDTGSGIDVERAVELLTADAVPAERPRQSIVFELPAATGDARLARKPSRRDVCEGHCKPMLLVEPRRERVSGLGVVKRGLSYRMSFRHTKSSRLSVIPDDEETSPTTSASTTDDNNGRSSGLSSSTTSAAPAFIAPTLPTNVSAKAVKLLGENVTEVLERSPVSPVTPTTPTIEWLNSEINHRADAQAHVKDSSITFSNISKPRITLQRVGTGAKKTSWNIPGRKRRETIIQPEIIGFAY
ncbi:hypothetical protein LTR70_008540 [Exophiala xenobiotica]|uniref:UBA domain-containing protein n=1 Tax=Lithohypha guttulata TaxID=1690604 RepID=A0ABR0K158_9EURO|nr:hypothetical protein LTR24_008168 [Lithohypha guttulata]KAK5311814.1 hypothetical protein LTR70_008540 [Exophiala xenobiotica]